MRRPLAGVLHRRGTVGQQPRGLDARRVVHELGADALKRADRLPELRPHERVVARRLVGTLRQADRERGDADTPGVEHLQGVDEPLALDAEQLCLGHAAVLEDHLARLAGAHPELVFLLAGAKPWRAALDDERRDAPRALAARGHRHHDDEIAVAAVGDELLGPVDHPVVAVADGGRAHGRRVAARRGLGEPPRRQLLAARPAARR